MAPMDMDTLSQVSNIIRKGSPPIAASALAEEIDRLYRSQGFGEPMVKLSVYVTATNEIANLRELVANIVGLIDKATPDDIDDDDEEYY